MSEDKQQNKEPGKIEKAGRVFLEELNSPPPKEQSRWRRMGQALLIPSLAILTGLLISGLIIIITSERETS